MRGEEGRGKNEGEKERDNEAPKQRQTGEDSGIHPAKHLRNAKRAPGSKQFEKGG